MPDHLPSAGPVGDLPDRDLIENACEVMHVAYERAAIGAGWETNPLSRTINWAEVPEANKATMRAAVAAVLPLIRAHIADEIDAVAEAHPGATELAGEFTYNRGIYNGFKRGARLARTGDWRKNDGTDTEASGRYR